MRINNKSEYLDYASLGLWNTFQHWDRLCDVHTTSSYVTIRNRRVGSRYQASWLPIKQLKHKYYSFVADGCRPEDIFIQDLGGNNPSSVRYVNAEITRSEFGLVLCHGAIGTSLGLRQDLEQNATSIFGLRALKFLEYYFDEPSRTEIEAILELVPGCVIEFTRFNRPTGIYNKELIVWEVRNF